MKPTIWYESWNPFDKFDFDFNKSVSISVETYEMDDTAEIKILILYLGESTQTLLHINNTVLDADVIKKFDKVYTHNQNILNEFSQAELVPFGSCWINFSDLTLDKKDHITFVTSSKNFTEGHNFRQQIYDYFETIDNINGFEIYQHKSPPYHNRRNDFFENAKFHISVENCREKNYFTEKLIDCFATKTIPIYWGCPNIADFFEMDGIITFDNLEDMKKNILSIDQDLYDRKTDAIEKNFELAKKYYGEYNITNRLYSLVSDYVSNF